MAKTPPAPPRHVPARPTPLPAPDPPPMTDPEAPDQAPPTEPPPRRPARQEDPPAAETRAGAVKVRAIRDGYYGEKYRRAGDVFTLERGDRLGKWMEQVHADTPEHTTSHGEALQGVRQEVMAQRALERGASGGVHAPVDNPDDGLDPIGAREG